MDEVFYFMFYIKLDYTWDQYSLSYAMNVRNSAKLPLSGTLTLFRDLLQRGKFTLRVLHIIIQCPDTRATDDWYK